MNMLTRRVLRALMVVVGDAEPADRAAALDEFEAVARLVALSHGLDPADLAAKGFSGYRSRRRGKKGSP